MPVSASKLVTLAQLQAQAERVKQELAKYTLASELGSLAKKSEISEADLSAALKSVIDGKMDAADSMTTEAINSAIATAIAKSAHARFEKVEKVPSNDEAQDNVLYLVMNAATGYYDIYAKVGEEVVRLDDTTVDLSNYATIEQLNAVSGGIGGTVYAGTKEDLSASDDSVIAAYFKVHTDVAVKKGDVFVVTTTVGNSTYEKSAYFYDGKAWVAMTGNVDADKVILRENITLAGGYTQVGNLTKSQNGTATFSTKGKSVMDALTEIFSKRLQPSITAQPSIGTFTLTGAGAVEAGTKVAAAAYSGASLSAGSYQYGPATGVTATNWKVERITNAATTQVATADAASLTAGSDNNGGAGFIIGDAGGDAGGDNAVSSLKYRVTATHGAGVTAKGQPRCRFQPGRCHCSRQQDQGHRCLHPVPQRVLRCVHWQAYSGQRGYPRTGQDRQGLRRRYADHQRPRRCAACGDRLHCDGQGCHQGHQRNRDERGCHQHLHQVYRVRRGRKWLCGEGLQRLDL